MGLQKVGSYTAIGCYSIIGIPLACVFALYCGFGIFGLAIGVSFAIFVQMICYSIILYSTDWQKVSDTACERI